MAPANQEALVQQEVDLLGEGESSGEITPGKSLVFAVLEVCLCLLVRQLPALNPSSLISTGVRPMTQHPEQSGQLISVALSVMEQLPKLCSPQGKRIMFVYSMYYANTVECQLSGFPVIQTIQIGSREFKKYN